MRGPRTLRPRAEHGFLRIATNGASMISSGRAHLAKGLSIAAAIALLGCGGPEAETPKSGDKSGDSNPLIGSPAPELDGEKVTGVGPAHLKDASGKVVIVD